ncbi:MAG: TlpA family protein disulfide reductase, partial [Bacteroidales bacterium]|nr:TlpA family protein disulfide reductase [Bacteroidales bacterium]
LINIILINIILLPAFIFVHDKTFIFYIGSFLFFILGYLLASNNSVKGLIVNFLLASVPFLLIAFAYLFINIYDFNLTHPERVLPIFMYYFICFVISFFFGVILKKKLKNKENRNLVFVSIIILFAAATSGILGRAFQFSIVGGLYLIGGLYIGYKKKRKNIKAVLILILPFILLFYPLVIFNTLKQMYPICIIVPISALSGIGLKLLYFKKNKVLFSALVIPYLLILFLGYFGMFNWLEYVFADHENNINAKELVFNFKTEENTFFTNNNIDGKITVLYFWIPSCSVCYKKFPELEKLYQKYSDRDDVLIIAVNLQTSYNNPVKNLNKVNPTEYNFPIATPDNDMEIYQERFGIQAFPKIIVIDKSGEIAFAGRFNNKPFVFLNNMDKMIQDLLNKS